MRLANDFFTKWRLQTWVIRWQDQEAPLCCHSPEIYIKAGSLQHPLPKLHSALNVLLPIEYFLVLNCYGGGGGWFVSLQVWKLINQPFQICLREIIVLSHYLLIFFYYFFLFFTFHYSQDLDFEPSPSPNQLHFWKVKSKDTFQLKSSKIHLHTSASSSPSSLFAQQDQIRLTGCTRVATNLIFS